MLSTARERDFSRKRMEEPGTGRVVSRVFLCSPCLRLFGSQLFCWRVVDECFRLGCSRVIFVHDRVDYPGDQSTPVFKARLTETGLTHHTAVPDERPVVQ